MAVAAQESLAVKTLTVVADTGYSNGTQGQACAEAGITAVVPRQTIVNSQSADLFSRDAFTYDPARDCWTCPAGETLTLVSVSRIEQKNTYATPACAACAIKAQCTRANGARSPDTSTKTPARPAHRRAVEDPGWMQRRRELVELPFGIIKWMMGYPRFLLRGRRKAKAELAPHGSRLQSQANHHHPRRTPPPRRPPTRSRRTMTGFLDSNSSLSSSNTPYFSHGLLRERSETRSDSG